MNDAPKFRKRQQLQRQRDSDKVAKAQRDRIEIHCKSGKDPPRPDDVPSSGNVIDLLGKRDSDEVC